MFRIDGGTQRCVEPLAFIGHPIVITINQRAIEDLSVVDDAVFITVGGPFDDRRITTGGIERVGPIVPLAGAAQVEEGFAPS